MQGPPGIPSLAALLPGGGVGAAVLLPSEAAAGPFPLPFPASRPFAGQGTAVSRWRSRRRFQKTDEQLHEHFPHLYPPAHRHLAADGGPAPFRAAGLSLSAHGGPAADRLPHHPGADPVPRRVLRGHGRGGHLAAGTATGHHVGPCADDLPVFGRGFGHHLAVRPFRAAGRSRAGGAGRHQRGGQPVAIRPAQSAGLQQGQPGGPGHHDAGGLQ